MLRWALAPVLLAGILGAAPISSSTLANPPVPRDLGTLWIDESNNVTHRVFGTRGQSVGIPLAAPDPDLEQGFPVSAFHGPGGYHAGPAIHALVSNIAGDGKLEIIATGLGGGPLYAWGSDGTPLVGWPVAEGGAGYPAAGKLQRGFQNVFAGYQGGWMAGYAVDGTYLSGWPRKGAAYIETPAALANIDTGRWEVFVEEEDWQLHAYRANGDTLPGWPVFGLGGSSATPPPLRIWMETVTARS